MQILENKRVNVCSKTKNIILWLVLLILFSFQPILERYFVFVKLFDEIVIILFFAVACVKILIRRTVSNFQLEIATVVFILLAVGVCGNYVSNLGQPVFAILQDIFSNCKLFMLVFSISVISFPMEQKLCLIEVLSQFIRLLFLVLFLCAFVSLFVDIGMTDYTEGTRYGLRAFQFIYNNPAGLNTYFYMFFTIYSLTLYKGGKLRKNASLFTFMGLFAWFLTLRSRAVVFSLLYLVVYVYIVYLRKPNTVFKFKWYYFVGITIVGISLSWSAIEKYFISNDSTSRFQLMYNSFKIASDYFPIGTGFGTYGTEASRAFYSNAYYLYNMYEIYGLSPIYPLYVVDQYWFGIIGQFGFIGSIAIFYMIYRIYRKIWNFSKFEKSNQLAALVFLFTSFLASFTAGTYIQASIVPTVLVLFFLKCEIRSIKNNI